MATGVTQAPSFFASNPDITAQSLRLQQQQALAQALMQQGMTPVQTEGRQIGGVAYRVSPMEGLAKMLQVYAGKKSLDDTINQQAGLQAQQFKLYQDALKGTVPESVYQDPPGGSGINLGGVTQPQPQAMDPQTKQLYGQYLANTILGNTEQAKQAYQAAIDRDQPTNEMKNWRAQGINPYELAPATRAAAFAPTFIDGTRQQIMPNGQAVVNPTYSLAKEAEQRQAGTQGTVSLKMPDGREAQVTPNEWEDYTRTGLLPKRFSPDYRPMGAGAPSTPVGVSQSPEAAKFNEGRAQNAVTYENALNTRVSSGRELMERTNEMLDLMGQIRTGGGQEVRAKAAQLAQAFGAPEGVIRGIAGGDLASTQAFETLAATKVLEDMKQALGPNMKGNRTEFMAFERANPNLDKDPNAIRKVFAFQQKMYAKDLDEQARFNQHIAEGKNPADFPGIFARSLPAPIPALPKPAANPKGLPTSDAIEAEIRRRQQRSGATGGW